MDEFVIKQATYYQRKTPYDIKYSIMNSVDTNNFGLFIQDLDYAMWDPAE